MMPFDKILRFLSSPTLIGLAFVLLFTSIYSSSWPLLASVRDRVEALAYDVRLWSSLPERVALDPRVIIVDIDEESLVEEGRWPWPRDRLAKMVENLFDAGTAVVAWDIVFAEPDRNPIKRLLSDEKAKAALGTTVDQLRALEAELDGDRAFAESFKTRDEDQAVVMGWVVNNSEQAPKGALPSALPGTEQVPVRRLPLRRFDTHLGNLEVLQEAAGSAGIFIVVPDEDGLIRRAPLVIRYKDDIYSSLALEAVRAHFGYPEVTVNWEEVGDRLVVESVDVGGLLNIPTDETGHVVVPYRGGAGSFHYVSASSVIKGDFKKELFENAIVLVGTSAEGLYDLRATPVEQVYPGVEIHANIILATLEGRFPHAGWLSQGVDLMVLLGLGVLFALWFPRLKPIWLLAVTATAVVLFIWFNLWLWRSQGLVTSLALPILLIIFLGVGNAVYGYLRENQGRQRLKSMFGQYIPPQLVEEMNLESGESFGFDGESREMTVLFCDIRSFTSISEKLSASELKQMLNYYFTPMTEIIFNNRGTIDKYVGDMVMAFWGAPLEDKDHRKHAILASLEMLERVKAMREELNARGWPALQVGIGLNSGPMNVGDMGSKFRRSYTVLGDSVNLGSRLESLTKYYGVGLIVSESTIQGVNDFVFRKLDMVRVKGKKEAVSIYEPICRSADASPMIVAELDEHERALRAYYRRDWDTAKQRFQSLSETNPNVKIYQLYLERIAAIRDQVLPDTWNGVFIHTAK